MNLFKRLFSKQDDSKTTCVACGYSTLSETGVAGICPVCYWEDEGVNLDPDVPEYGPNGELSLNKARQNFVDIGAVDRPMLAYVRAPRPAELIPGKPDPLTIEKRQNEARLKYGISKDPNSIFS